MQGKRYILSLQTDTGPNIDTVNTIIAFTSKDHCHCLNEGKVKICGMGKENVAGLDFFVFYATSLHC